MANGESGRGPITDYRNLDVWNEAMTLATDVYQVTKTFPKEEMFGMTSQMRRAAVSVGANIAEGFGRAQTRPFIQFLRIAQGSLKELETLTMLAERLTLLPGPKAATVMVRCERVGKMLVGLVRALENKDRAR